MDKDLIEKFERALKREFEIKHDALDLEYRERLFAFRVASGRPVVKETVDSGNGTDPEPEKPRFYGGGEAVAISNHAPSMLAATREALKHVDGTFTSRDLVPLINRIYPNLNVTTEHLSNPLWALSSKGEIEKVESGLGKNPHKYKRK